MQRIAKRVLFLLVLFAVFVGGYFYFNKPKPIEFKDVANLHLVRISDETLEIDGDLVFHNPNSMRAQLGKLSFDLSLNGTTIGKIHEGFTTAIKGDENFNFSFQIRFPKAEVIKDDTLLKELPLTITGSAGSDVVFSNYSFPVNYSGTVKNSY
jgi:LEA14-like dessication related protein